MTRPVTTMEQVRARVLVTAAGCWEWQGPVHPYSGYPERIRVRTRRYPVYRYVYELCRGPIPDGLQLDHLCRNRLCVNPDHLEPVTPKENVARADSPPGRNARATGCRSGHPLDLFNTYVTPDGRRQCRACRREAVRRFKERTKESVICL